jgi:hypothetical protein
MNGEQTGDFLLISATKTGDIGDIYNYIYIYTYPPMSSNMASWKIPHL